MTVSLRYCEKLLFWKMLNRWNAASKCFKPDQPANVFKKLIEASKESKLSHRQYVVSFVLKSLQIK